MKHKKKKRKITKRSRKDQGKPCEKRKRKESKRKKFYETKQLEVMKEREKEVKKNEEDLAIIEDENAFPLLDKEAAEAGVAERNEELVRLQTQVKERDAISLAKKIGKIFKKYGVTVTSVLVAAGITIGTVIRVIRKLW